MSQITIKCPACGSNNVEGFVDDCETGFCRTDGGMTFRCCDCNYWFGEKEVT